MNNQNFALKKTRGRYEWVDVAKGIGIILVVLGHLNKSGQLNREIIYAFHMPLFFFLSGMFSSTNKSFGVFIKNLIKSLYVPYAVFTIIDVVAFYCSDLKTMGLNLACSLSGFDFVSVVNRPLWFLFILFEIKLLCYFLDKCRVLKYAVCVLSFAVPFFSVYFSQCNNNLWLRMLTGLPFFILGSLLKNKCIQLEGIVAKHKIPSLLASALMLVLLIYTSRINGNVDMGAFVFGNNAVLYLLNSMLGTFAVIIISILLSQIKVTKSVFVFYGKSTMIILVGHYYLCRRLIPYLFSIIGIKAYLYKFAVELLLCVAVMLIMTALIPICKKYLYFLFGIKKAG